MAVIDKSEFVNRCKAVDPQFAESTFSALFSKIDAYNTALGKVASPPTASRESSFLRRVERINPQYTSKILEPVRSEPGLYDKMLKQATNSSATQIEIELMGIIRGILPEVRLKYSNSFTYLNDRLKGKITKPDESAIFKISLTVPGRTSPLELRGEGFPSLAAMEEVGNNLKLICPMVRELARSERIGPRRTWFAQESLSEVQSALVNLDMYLNHRCTGISFKVLQTGNRCDNSAVGTGLAGQVLPTVMLKGEDRPDFRAANGYLKVPSGLRIFLGPLYFSVRTNYDPMLKTVAIYRFMTLFHEMSHKIIKTTDQVYELDKCQNIKDTPKAVMCADSWGYFLTDYAAQTNRLPGGKSTTSSVASLRSKFGG